jgi:hypothetical protein
MPGKPAIPDDPLGPTTVADYGQHLIAAVFTPIRKHLFPIVGDGRAAGVYKICASSERRCSA